MADTTIANLTDGTTADSTDRIPVERSPFGVGTNRYITPEYIKTYLGAGLTSGRLALVGTSGVIQDSSKYLYSSTAGEGLTLAAGTAASAVSALNLTQTWNFNSSAITGVKWTFTDTSSHSSTMAFQIFGGAAGSSNLLSISRGGALTTGGDITLGTGGRAFQAIGAQRFIMTKSSTLGSLAVDGVAGVLYRSDTPVSWVTSTDLANASADVGMARNGANGIVFAGATTSSGAVTSRTEINKAVTAFTDAVAKATFTITVPNAAHSAAVQVQFTASIGAGGAIGANEASATISYDIAIARTAGVNAVATISTAYGSAAAAVAGATTCTVTAAMSAVSGAVGATNTFTIDVTITRGGGSSDNHTCLCYAKLMNANASGITIA